MNKDLIPKAVTAAFINAEVAGKAKFEQVGERDSCGFSWIIIRPARGPLVSYLKKQLKLKEQLTSTTLIIY